MQNERCKANFWFFDNFCKFNKTLFSRRVRRERRVLIINSPRPLRSPREALFAKNVKEPNFFLESEYFGHQISAFYKNIRLATIPYFARTVPKK